MVAAGKPEAAKLAGESGDGFIGTSPERHQALALDDLEQFLGVRIVRE